MSVNFPQFKLRMPHGLKQWAEKKAETEHRTINSQIVHMLEKIKKQEEGASNNV